MNPTRFAVACLISLSIGHAQAQVPRYDTIIRHGTVLDGSGNPRYDADIAVRNGFIVAIGDLAGATAATEIEARGLFVTPGFINIHSHASPDALPTAVNMLTQGVTTEIFNADGNGPLDLAQQMQTLAAPGLAVNIGGYIGFNTAWQAVNGNADKRPTPVEIEQMRALIAKGLEQGAWGVSAGLDYKPGYFARTEEVIKIVDVARPARTNFTNHDRITPESNYSSKVGVTETVAIGQKAGLVPVVTHMKAQGLEQGTAGAILASMDDATRRGAYTAADAYPYLAGQSGLGSLIIPGWAQEGGRAAMLTRFADPAERARIITEAEQAMTARFGGPQGVYLPRTQQELTAVMAEMNAGAGETIVRILETTGDPGAILRFGSEADLVKILQHPTTSMACDCGASTATRVHPRFYGSYPRVLGRYVREQQIMSWEEAIRKSSALPAATIGMIDRGLIAVGMAADLVVLNPATVIDRATYEEPALPSEGIRHVLVNGAHALSDGAATGRQSGRALLRGTGMPSRPMATGARSVTAELESSDGGIAIDVTQRAGARSATGRFEFGRKGGPKAITATRLGVLQTVDGWASVSGIGTFGDGTERAFVATIDRHEAPRGLAMLTLTVEGEQFFRGAVSLRTLTAR
ncbi:MAG: amidohydrolase family protein [Acidobacteriota bacterium]|nr:amidohydrolase family protein [Acidobacteriota bacterium]